MTTALNIQLYKGDNSVIRHVLPADVNSDDVQMLIYPYLQKPLTLPSEMVTVVNGVLQINFTADFTSNLQWQVAEYEIKASNTTLFEGELRITARDFYLNQSQSSTASSPPKIAPRPAPCPSFDLQIVTRAEAQADFNAI